MSELSQAESCAVQAFNELLQADDAASSQPLSPAATVSDDLVAETDPYPDPYPDSQPLSPASDDNDYSELGDVVEQVCGAGYYEKIVRLTSYKSQCKKLKAENCKLRKDKNTLLKQCQNWKAKAISLANPAVPGKSTTKEDHQSLINHQRPIQRHQKQIALKRKHQQPKVAIGQSLNCAIKLQQDAKMRHTICIAKAPAKAPPKPPPPPKPPSGHKIQRLMRPPQPYQ